MTDENFKIDRDVPLPKNNHSLKYDFDQMNVGDSIFVEEGTPAATFSPKATSPRIAQAAAAHARKFGKKFTTRKVEGGYRTWRLK